MRQAANAERVRRFMEALGRGARGPGDVYLTGGATAVLHGWRDSTVDIDIKLDPEPAGAFEAIDRLKNELDVNVELAAPDQFLPELPGWRERSVVVATHGRVRFLHYDYYAQALAKIERGHARDDVDVRAMLAAGLVERERLWELLRAIEPALIRFPTIDAARLHERMIAIVGAAPHA